MAAIFVLFARDKLTTWLRLLTYGLFLFWVCGIGSFIYIELFSTYYGLQSYHIAILEGNSDQSNQQRITLPAGLSKQFGERVDGGLYQSPRLINIYQTTVASTLSNLINHCWLAPNINPICRDSFLLDRVLDPILIENPGWLSPPDKPPS